MSYILDALKKAERERDIQQVPTLMAAHEPRGPRPKGVWILIGLSVVCVGTAVWYLMALRETMNPGEAAPATTAYRQSSDNATAQKMAPAEVPSPAGQAAQARETGSSVPVSGNAASGAKPMESPRTREKANSTVQASDETTDEADELISAEQAILERRVPPAARSRASGVKIEKPASEPDRPQPASLQEALNGMTLSLLVYDEDHADRMVFINGRKYIEGDLIEGVYLVESISLEGAILSHNGERVLLRSKSK
jgi:general secretion pathway protein B